MSTVKEISIKNAGGTYDTNPVGAEAQYVEVSRDSNGDIIEDITATGVTVSSTEGLAETLKNLEESVAGSNEFSEMTDVNFTSLADKNMVQYNATSGKWENKPIKAEDAAYDNTTSGLTATKVQAAIDEVDSNYDSLKETFTKNGAHNLNNTPYKNFTAAENYGVTWVVNSDGTLLANGTATQTSANPYWNDNESGFVAPFSAQVILSGVNSGNPSIHIFPLDRTDNVRPYTDSTKTARLSVNDNVYNGNEISFYMEKGHTYAINCRLFSGATASNVLFKPMLRLASDTDSTYEPYAKTNKQLTDVAEQEIGNYMYKGVHAASVSADGVKDYETLINDLSLVMLAKLQALADDEIVFIKQVLIGGNTSPIINKFISEFKNTATSFDIDYSKTTINVGTGVNIMWGRLNTTKSGVRCASVSLNAGTAIPTPTDLRNTVPTSGTSFSVYYQVYKKIS